MSTPDLPKEAYETIGRYAVNSVVVMMMLGHSTPVNSMMYQHVDPDDPIKNNFMRQFVDNFMVACSKRSNSPECDALRDLIRTYQLDRVAMEGMAELLG